MRVALNNDIRMEELNGDLVVLAGDTSVVHRLSGAARELVEHVRAGHTDVPAHLQDAATHLESLGIITISDNVTRRFVLKGATSATVAGIVTIALPRAAAAASGDVQNNNVDPSQLGGSGSIAAPLSVGATAGDGQVTVSWSAVSGATSYTVYYRGSGASSFTLVATLSSLSFAVLPLVNDVTYEFAVTATDGTNTSALSSVASATPVAPAPGTPINLVVAASSGQLDANWDPAVSGGTPTSYTVTITPAGGSTTTYTGVVDSAYTFTGLTNGVTYTVTVTAVNSGGSSSAASASGTPVSASQKATPAPTPQPPVLNATTTTTLATISIDNTSGYTYQKQVDGGSWSIITAGAAFTQSLTAASHTVAVRKTNGVTTATSTVVFNKTTTTYAPAGSAYTILGSSTNTGTREVSATIIGGCGGKGGNDDTRTGGNPGSPGTLISTIALGKDESLVIAAGGGGGKGNDNAKNNGAGAGGTNAIGGYSGGTGGKAGGSGTSGSGGGGGAASVVRRYDSGNVLVASYVAHGSGAGGGACAYGNGGNSGEGGGGAASGTNGGQGTDKGSGDGGGGGGGGGGVAGGTGGGLITVSNGRGWPFDKYEDRGKGGNNGTSTSGASTVSRTAGAAGSISIWYYEVTSITQS